MPPGKKGTGKWLVKYTTDIKVRSEELYTVGLTLATRRDDKAKAVYTTQLDGRYTENKIGLALGLDWVRMSYNDFEGFATQYNGKDLELGKDTKVISDLVSYRD